VRRGTPGNRLLHGLVLLLAVPVFLLAGSGCHWGKPEKPAAETVPPSPGEIPSTEETRAVLPGGAEIPVAAPPVPSEPPAEAKAAAIPSPEGSREPEKQEPVSPGGEARKGKQQPVEARPPAPHPAHADTPAWAMGKEELVYRVEFLGVTMGYARFTFKGKVAYNGKEVYHLSVRAWTSDFLSVIYPINDTIDYYLDLKTLAPLRQEYTRAGKGKDDIAFYDQEKGKIVYRYKHNGEIRKQVEVPPDVHDPVSAAYYFRTRDLGASERPRNMYAGRKLWQISTKTLGVERIETLRGPVDTVVIQPVIKRDGQPDNKGDLKMWMTNDARHVPVKIYAKFRKIRMWTLTAELVPAREGG
jgi:hypothetical protein